jgi:hypothetical protein
VNATLTRDELERREDITATTTTTRRSVLNERARAIERVVVENGKSTGETTRTVTRGRENKQEHSFTMATTVEPTWKMGMWTECIEPVFSDSEDVDGHLETVEVHQAMDAEGSNARSVNDPPEWLVALTDTVQNTRYDADEDEWIKTDDGTVERQWCVISLGWEYRVMREEVDLDERADEATTMWTALGPADRERDDESDDDDEDEDEDEEDEEDDENDDEDEWEVLDDETGVGVAEEGVDETREAGPTSDVADRSSQREDSARKGDENDDGAVNDVLEKCRVTIMRSKMTMTEEGADTFDDVVKSIDETMKKAAYKAVRAYKIAELRVRSGVAACFHDVSNVPKWIKRLASRHVDCLQPRFVFVAIGATGTFMIVRREWLLRAEKRSRSSFVEAERLSDDTNREFQEIGLHYIL